MRISVAGEMMMLVSRTFEIRPEKDYPESSAICPNEMHYGTKSVVGNVPAPIQKVRNKRISRLHADRDACKESTDTSREATRGCSATLNPVMVPKLAPMATDEDGQRQKRSARGTPSLSVVGGCQIQANTLIVGMIQASGGNSQTCPVSGGNTNDQMGDGEGGGTIMLAHGPGSYTAGTYNVNGGGGWGANGGNGQVATYQWSTTPILP